MGTVPKAKGIASIAAKIVVEALDRVRSRDSDDRLVGDRAEVIISERRHTCGVNCLNLPPCAAVGERYRRRAVGVDGVSQGAVVVIAVRRDNPASPGAGRELAVGSVGVRWPLPVGVDLVHLFSLC